VDADETLVPSIELESETLHVGKIANDKVHRTEFEIFNRGTAPLIVRSVKTECACTQGSLPEDRNVILPGDSTMMDIVLNPYRMPSFESTKTLTIATNDPNRPLVNLPVSATVEPEFMLEPPTVDFGEVRKGASKSITFVLTQLQDDLIEIHDVTTHGPDKSQNRDNDLLEVDYVMRPESEWATPGKAEYEITVTLKPTAPPGPVSELFYITSNVKRLPTFRHLVTAIVVAPYSVKPAPPRDLILRNDEQGVYRGAIEIAADSAVTISDIAPSDLLAATVESVEGAKLQTIQVILDDAAPEGPFQGHVEFKVTTADGTFPESLGVRTFVK